MASAILATKTITWLAKATEHTPRRLHIHMWWTLSDLELPDSLSSVCVRDVECYDPLEKLYFSMKYDPIYICCCGDKNRKSTEGYYPQCELCADKTPVAKRVRTVSSTRTFLCTCFVHPSTIIYFSACFVCQIVSSDHSSCLCVLCIKKSVPTGFTLCVS